ncbi:acyl-CoA carboxylase subunit epsilon [Streptomyces lydicus]|uniref:acyl-CoA carboxylase subunit epsilon n=1 Tax=Streptomyces lydicus TaxID=47763 RepID=UPI00286FF51A|nr:acyl-CoA carboxylase subunit epsilon [Streptomyces lydicus]
MNAFTDESGATGQSARAEETTPSEETADRADLPADAAAGAEAGQPTVTLSAFSLRIEKGHAEPEELAALTVVLCAQLAGARAPDDGGQGEERPAARRPTPGHRAGRSACWSGCWTCS